MQSEQETTVASVDVIWGAKAIGREIGRTDRQAYHLLESGRLPARKDGGIWISSRAALRKHYEITALESAS